MTTIAVLGLALIRAPNVVVVLIDDIGFGGPSTFGGPIRTPTMDQLSQAGLRFNNFHTTALRRRALLLAGQGRRRREHAVDVSGHLIARDHERAGNSPAEPEFVADHRSLHGRRLIDRRTRDMDGPGHIGAGLGKVHGDLTASG
jgi:hypothetical protein